METISRRMAEFVSRLSVQDLPAEVIWKAKACLLYGLSIAMAACDSRSAQIAEAAILESEALSGSGSTTVLSGQKTTPSGAAFANGVLFQGRGQSDAYGTMAHFGPAVIPAVLALAEQQERSGPDILAALVAGYEVAAALAKDHIKLSVARGWRGSPTYGVLGAAAAAARLMQLGAEEAMNALGFAACFTFGNVECNIAHTMETHFELGLASRNGLISSWVARHRGRAAPTAIEGKAGFLNLFAGTTEFAGKVTQGLGKRFEILEVTFKRYPTSMIAQSPVYLAVSLARQEDLNPEDVKEVLVELDPFEAEYPGKGRRQDEDPADRGVGTAQGVAAALVYRRASRDLLRRRDDARIARLLERISIKGSEGVAPLCARLMVRTDRQEYFKETTDGARNHLFGYEDTVELVRELRPEMRVSKETLEKMIELIRGLESADRIRPLIMLATQGAT